jgi:hypothetical protein
MSDQIFGMKTYVAVVITSFIGGSIVGSVVGGLVGCGVGYKYGIHEG